VLIFSGSPVQVLCRRCEKAGAATSVRPPITWADVIERQQTLQGGYDQTRAAQREVDMELEELQRDIALKRTQVRTLEESRLDYDRLVDEMSEAAYRAQDFYRTLKETTAKINERALKIEQVTAMACKVCFTARIDTALCPCGHTICRSCFDKANQAANQVKCPFCNEPDPWPMKVYL